MKNLFGKMVSLAFALATFVSVTLSANFSENYNNSKIMEDNMSAEKNIVEIAKSNSDFSTLVKALVAADLVSVLQGKGPFTVFAPANAAFAKLPAGTLENLLKPENKVKLSAILTYHVVSGKVLAADVKTMKAKTVNGKDLDIKVNGSIVTVNGAKVIKTDIVGSNGVIHVIDTVLLP
ncbi:MAG: fasciclin domain-containing protein [Parachlamydiaceae bacterium]